MTPQHWYEHRWASLVMAAILVFFAFISVVGLIGPDTIGLPENV